MSSSNGTAREDAHTAPAAAGGLGPYTDLAAHAAGSLGEVLKATDADLHRTVAVKRLQECHAGSADSRRRFRLEAEITARLEHPGVVPVYALFTDDSSRLCYAMRFIEGPTLADAIRDYHAGAPGPVAFRRLLQSFLQVCQTVAYAHSRGVIHRDLKPANVMLGRFGETLVVDWGLAKAVGRPDEVRALSLESTLYPAAALSGAGTALGAVVGTPAFMSPEQAAARWDQVNAASDVYSLGAVLYNLLTGRPPLGRGTWADLLQKIQRGDFPRPRQLKADVPRALEAVCRKAMAPNQYDRYPSALALAADVERYLADEPVSAWREPLWARGWRWLRRHKASVGVAALLVAAVLAGAAAGLTLLERKTEEVAAQRDLARAEAEQTQRVNEFLTESMLGGAGGAAAEEALQKAARTMDGPPPLAGRPDAEAALRLALGKALLNRGNYEEAEPQLLAAERAFRDSPAAHPRHHRQAAEQLARLYDAWGKPEQGERWRSQP